MPNETFEFENCKIIFRNFEGRQQKFNPPGKRNFCLVINPADADELAAAGFNVKTTNPKREDDVPENYIKVNVNYATSKNPPKIYMIAGRRKTLLTEQTVGELDYADIKHIDLIISSYPWKQDDGSQGGLSAYVSKMYVEIVEDRFAEKYTFDDDEETPFL